MTPILSAIALTLRDPAAAWGWLRGLRLAPQDILAAAVAVVSVSTLLGWLTLMGAPQIEGDGPAAMLHASPITVAGLQLSALIFGAMLMAMAGRAFGGAGSFTDCMLAMAWIEVVLIAVQVIQAVLMLLFPALATLLTLVGLALFLYLVVRFAAAVHGFRNPLLVAVGMVGTLMLASLVLAILGTTLGILPAPVAP